MEFGVVVPENVKSVRKSKYRDMYCEFLNSDEETARVDFETIKTATSAKNTLTKIAKDDGDLVRFKRIDTYVYFMQASNH